jgi:hypothetical protein
MIVYHPSLWVVASYIYARKKCHEVYFMEFPKRAILVIGIHIGNKLAVGGGHWNAESAAL